MWLSDTNIISELMRRTPDAGVMSWANDQNRFTLSSITVDEISFGLHRQNLKEKIKWFERFIEESCEVLPIDQAAALRAGRMRGQLASTGKAFSQADRSDRPESWTHHCDT
jgi:predicted nucleic acid-binding protein